MAAGAGDGAGEAFVEAGAGLGLAPLVAGACPSREAEMATKKSPYLIE